MKGPTAYSENVGSYTENNIISWKQYFLFKLLEFCFW